MRKRIGIGGEGILHKQFATAIKKLQLYKQVYFIQWTYNAAGEKRSITTASLLKTKGVQKGHPDYVFYGKDNNNYVKIVWIEFKYGKNKTTEEQKEFQNSFIGINNTFYYVAYSVEEAMNILKQHNLIKL
jgi:hypothetical protein